MQRLLATAARYGDMVKVVRVPGAFSEQVLGGDQIRTSEILCSAGFNVTKGDQDYVLTAGHCTQGLPYWRGLGPSVSSNFPNTDFGLIRNESGDAPAAIDRYDGTEQPITSVGTATVGEAVCASGMTTGITCGQVTAVDQTVDYGNGDVVNGLIQTNVHTDHGDSGGPLFAGSAGLGTVSGGDGTTDFFQPLTVALATLGANLSRIRAGCPLWVGWPLITREPAVNANRCKGWYAFDASESTGGSGASERQPGIPQPAPRNGELRRLRSAGGHARIR